MVKHILEKIIGNLEKHGKNNTNTLSLVMLATFIQKSPKLTPHQCFISYTVYCFNKIAVDKFGILYGLIYVAIH